MQDFSRTRLFINSRPKLWFCPWSCSVVLLSEKKQWFGWLCCSHTQCKVCSVINCPWPKVGFTNQKMEDLQFAICALLVFTNWCWRSPRTPKECKRHADVKQKLPTGSRHSLLKIVAQLTTISMWLNKRENMMQNSTQIDNWCHHFWIQTKTIVLAVKWECVFCIDKQAQFNLDKMLAFKPNWFVTVRFSTFGTENLSLTIVEAKKCCIVSW